MGHKECSRVPRKKKKKKKKNQKKKKKKKTEPHRPKTN